MRLWRLTRPEHVTLDGAGAARFGGRYSSPGRPVVPFASEAGLAILVALRYLPKDQPPGDADFVLGWTDSDAVAQRVPDGLEPAAIIAQVDGWLEARRSLLLALSSAVLPEADIILMNPLYPAATLIPPLTCRPFSFAECLHRPPMLDAFDR